MKIILSICCLLVIEIGQSQVNSQRPNRFQRAQEAARGQVNSQQSETEKLDSILKVDEAIDIREAVHQNFLRQQKLEIKRALAVANKECKKLIMRNAAFLAKGCLPAVTVAIKNAEIKEDVFDTLQGIFNRAIDVTSGPQCMSQFVQYHQQLKQAGCNELAQIHEDNMNQIRMGQIFKKMTESFGTPENALATFREMNSATCEPNLTAFAQYTTQNLRAVCPLTSNAIEDYIKVSKTVGRGN